MPDILIRMEMPKNCFQCLLSVLNGERLFCKVTKEEVLRAKLAPECPIVELPPHGDLVDATQYRDEFMDGVYNMCADDPDNNRANVIIDLYDCAPVIVPAERRDADA